MDILTRPTFTPDEGAPPLTVPLYNTLDELITQQPEATLAVFNSTGHTHEEVLALAAGPQFGEQNTSHEARVVRTLAAIFGEECDLEVTYDDSTESAARMQRDRIPRHRVRHYRLGLYVGRTVAWLDAHQASTPRAA